MDVAEWIALLFTLSTSAKALRGPVAALRARRHLRCLDVRISCPRTGTDVDCTLARDGRTGVYTGALACSASNAGGRPTCDQDCVWIMNLGIPLLPKDCPANEEIREADEELTASGRGPSPGAHAASG